jgi:transposase-like protein
MDGQNSQRQDAGTNVSMIDRGQSQMILNELPPPDTKRWVVRRKAAVVAAVKNGAITLEEVCRRYNLSAEEFLSWQEMIDKHGVRGLRVTRLQDYRAP